MKTKNDLKAALNSLQVNKPLRLTTQRPEFTPPTSVTTETQVTELTQVSVATPVTPQTQVSEPTPVDAVTGVSAVTPVAGTTTASTVTQVSAATPVTVPTQASGATPVTGVTQVSPLTQVGREPAPSTACTQDSSVTLEAQTVSKLHNGYTRLPNDYLMRMVAGELQRSEIQILLLIARYTISFQRRHAPLSKTVLERQTGLSGPAVLQALASLQTKGLIEKITGDQHRPNQLGLVFSEEWDFFSKQSRSCDPQTPVTPVTSVTPLTPVTPPTPAPVSTVTPGEVTPLTDYKERETRENKQSPSQLPEALHAYFSELKPAKKRESEWAAFQSLRADYPDTTVADCLAHVLERGVGHGESTQTCHSPMAFLSKAIGAVLPEVVAQQRRTRERLERELREVAGKQERAAEEAREKSEWAKKERAFSKAFPSEERQHEALTDILRGFPLRPSARAARVMGISKWWSGLKASEQMELSE